MTDLADEMDVTKQWLSQYINGKDQRGAAFDTAKLNERHATILHHLRRKSFPTEMPTAAEAAAAATAAAATAAAADKCAKPAKSTPAAPLFAAEPKVAVLSVSLRDVAGWTEGGDCHIMALGVPVLGDNRWVMPCPGSDSRELRLR
eukprot:4166804-Prymnesium_polylepis.1